MVLKWPSCNNGRYATRSPVPCLRRSAAHQLPSRSGRGPFLPWSAGNLIVLPLPVSKQYTSPERIKVRLRYKNVSSKAIRSGRVGVESLSAGPTHDVMHVGWQTISLGSLRVGQSKRASMIVTSSSSWPPRFRIEEVSFSDGSHWSPADPSRCLYGQLRLEPPVPPIPPNPVPSDPSYF